MLASLEKHVLEEALRERRFADLRESFEEHELADVAEAIDGLDSDNRAVVFRLLRNRRRPVVEFTLPEPLARQADLTRYQNTEVRDALDDDAF